MLSRLGTPQLIVAAALLLGGGLVMIYSASAVRSELIFGSSWVYVGRQLGVAVFWSRLSGRPRSSRQLVSRTEMHSS